MARAYGQACPVARTLELVGERWTLLIVRDLLRHGARRFQDLLVSLPGLAPNVLSERLKLMEQHGLVARRFYSDHPPRAEYALTEAGAELRTVVGALALWGARHVAPDAAVVHAACDHPVDLAYFCPACHQRVPAGTVTVKPAPRRPAAAPPRAARRSVRRADSSPGRRSAAATPPAGGGRRRG
jgi:DNA-binding HxlR family transcriptional regulator